MLQHPDASTVNIIIPVYNTIDYLGECLDSVLAQTYPNIEVIVVDDGSTDGSIELARRYEREHPNLHVLEQPNKGPGAARNLGIDNSQGEYLLFVDSDDILPTTILEELHDALVREEAELAMCRIKCFNSQKSWAWPTLDPFDGRLGASDVHENPCLILDTSDCGKLIRRRFLVDNGFRFSETLLYEDVLLIVQMLCTARKIATVQSTGYFWRRRDGENESITQRTRTLRNLVDRLTVTEQLDAFFRNRPELEGASRVWDMKVLSTDLMIFVNQIAENPELQNAAQYAAEIRRYLDESGKLHCIDAISPLQAEKIRAFLSDDIEKLAALRAYQKDGYAIAPVSMTADGRAIAHHPKGLFANGQTDITAELAHMTPRSLVNGIRVDQHSITVSGYVYTPRYSMPLGTQTIRVFLQNANTGELFALTTHLKANRSLTKAKGVLTADGADHGGLQEGVEPYDYDGTGFSATIDFLDDETSELPAGRYLLIAHHASTLKEGYLVLSRTTKDVRKRCANVWATGTRLRAAMKPERFGNLSLSLREQAAFLHVATVQDDNLVLETTSPVSGLALVSDDGAIELPLSEAGTRHSIACSQLPDNTACQVMLLSSDGTREPLPSFTRSLQILKGAGYALLVQSLGDGCVHIERHGKLYICDDIAAGGASSIVIACHAVGNPCPQEGPHDVSLLVSNGRTGESLSAAPAYSEAPGSIERFEFDLDALARFAAQAQAKAFELAIRTTSASGAGEEIQLLAPTHFKREFAGSKESVVVYRNAHGQVALRPNGPAKKKPAPHKQGAVKAETPAPAESQASMVPMPSRASGPVATTQATPASHNKEKRGGLFGRLFGGK